MANLGMEGPWPFTSDEVKEIGAGLTGNYALGHLNDGNAFVPEYVGRSDSDLRQELLQRLKTHPKPYFKASSATSSKAAFKQECRNYHDFEKQLENEIHPDRPDGADWTCPVCDNFE